MWYPVAVWPFTRTPSSRNFSIQRHTCCRVTPISFAICPPLITIVAFSASSVSSASIRLSVIPGKLARRFVGFVVMRHKKHTRRAEREQGVRTPALLQLLQSFHEFLILGLACSERRLEIIYDLRRSLARKRLVRQPRFLRFDILLQSLDFLLQFGDFCRLIDGVTVSNPQVELRGRTHRRAFRSQRSGRNGQLGKGSQPRQSV